MPDNDYQIVCDGNCQESILRYYYHPTQPGHIDLIPDNFGFYKIVNHDGAEVESWIECLDHALAIWSRLKRLSVCPTGIPQWMSAE